MRSRKARRKNQRLNPALTFELVIARDDLLDARAAIENDKPGSDPQPFDRGGRDAIGDDPAETFVRQRAARVADIAGRARAAMDGARVCN